MEAVVGPGTTILCAADSHKPEVIEDFRQRVRITLGMLGEGAVHTLWACGVSALWRFAPLFLSGCPVGARVRATGRAHLWSHPRAVRPGGPW